MWCDIQAIIMAGIYVSLLFGLFTGISAVDDGPALSAIVSNPWNLIQCPNATFSSTCHNTLVVPYGFAGLDGANIPTSQYSIQNMLFENDDNLTKLLCNHKVNDNGPFCPYSEVENCTSRIPFFLKTLFPTEERIGELQKIICGSRQNYDTKCVSSKMDEIISCANVSDVIDKALNDTPVSKYTELMENVTCRFRALARQCARRLLDPCGQTTMQMYIQTIPNYPECEGRSEIQQSAVDCRSMAETKFSFFDCFFKTKFFTAVPNLPTSEQTSDYILKTLTLGENKEMCSNLPIHLEAINCTLNVQRQCSDSAMKPTVPDPSAVTLGFAQLCNNLDNFNTSCVVSRTKNACMRRRRESIRERIILKHFCEEVNLRNTCLVSAVRFCGSRTAAVYKKVLLSQLPEMCLKDANGHVPVVG